jgi:hypothetical protein
MQMEAHIGFMRVLVEVVDPVGIEKGAPAFDTVDDVSFFQQ